ncbi:MAG: hypothetical protein ACYTF1_24170 [Planctomycetota bacterium]|jgi:hypothetical protein
MHQKEPEEHWEQTLANQRQLGRSRSPTPWKPPRKGSYEQYTPFKLSKILPGPTRGEKKGRFMAGKTDSKAAKVRFLEILDKLIKMVEFARPGFEFDQIQELFTELTKIAQRSFGRRIGIGDFYPRYRLKPSEENGNAIHSRELLLAHPVSDDTLTLLLYTFEGPPSILGSEENEKAQQERDKELEAIEYMAVKENRVQRHITTKEERDRILSWLHQWRSHMSGDNPQESPAEETQTTAKTKKRAKNWTVDSASRKVELFISQRQEYYDKWIHQIQRGNYKAKAKARADFGRAALSKALNIPLSTISNTRVYQEKIQPYLGTKNKGRHTIARPRPDRSLEHEPVVDDKRIDDAIQAYQGE